MSAQGSCCCGGVKTKNVLLYACSGGANVAEASDRACRQLMGEGVGGMFCLAGLGAGIEGMVQQARDADLNVVIDGCPMDCARKIFDKLGLTNVHFVRVTDMGLEKKPKGVRATDAEVKTIVDNVKQALAAA
jgi:uncharacterized metal-binding protein